VTVRLLTNEDQEIIRFFLQKDELSNLYLLDLLDRQGIDYWGFCRWHGFFNQQKLIALNVDISCLQKNEPCKLSIPIGDKEACNVLGYTTKQHGGTEKILSEREASDGFYSGLESPPYRIIQSQKLFYTNKLLEGDFLPLRPAQEQEFTFLYNSTAQMRLEDEQYDPRVKNAELWTKTVQALLAQQRILIGEKDGTPCFVIEVGTRCKIGAQVGSTYVLPEFRRQGLSVRGMRGLVRSLLPTCNRISLLAHEENIPAIACYRRAGFIESTPFRLIELLT
jgi:GNAT superfamily N-acetyltransferase